MARTPAERASRLSETQRQLLLRLVAGWPGTAPLSGIDRRTVAVLELHKLIGSDMRLTKLRLDAAAVMLNPKAKSPGER